MDNLSLLSSIISDHAFHSGERLRVELGYSSRSAVNRLIKELHSLGVDVYSISGKGYKLSGDQWLYSDKTLKELFDAIDCDVVRFVTTDSTSLQAKKSYPKGRVQLCVSDQQTGGRGRFERKWSSPMAKNVYATLSVPVAVNGKNISSMTLVVGLALCEVLKEYGAKVGLKWPNDIVTSDFAKVGGILTEFMGDFGGDGHVFIGFGINAGMSPDEQIERDKIWSNAFRVDASLDKNEFVFALVDRLLGYLEAYLIEGFSFFQSKWRDHDFLLGRQIDVVDSRGNQCSGVYVGVDALGQMILDKEGEKLIFAGGEVSVGAII